MPSWRWRGAKRSRSWNQACARQIDPAATTMTLELWLAYVVTVLVLMSTPGPSYLLILSTSLSNGFVRSTATAAGDLSANVLQILAAGLGLAALLAASPNAFAAIKWAGVGYLMWLGGKKIARSFRTSDEVVPTRPSSPRRLWLRGFVTSATNPKPIIFFAALFPQFLREPSNFWFEMFVLGGTYLAIDGVFLCAFGAGAGWLGGRLRGPARTWVDRAAGGGLIAAAVLLGLKTVEGL